MNKLLFITLASITCLFTGQAYANKIMQPGAWKFDSSVTATNPNTGKRMNMGNTSMTMCLEKDFLASDPYLSGGVNKEKMQQKGARCDTSNYSRSGTSATWTMTCTMANGGKVVSNIKASAKKSRYSATMDQTTNKGGTSVSSTMKINARHAGDCTPNMARP